MDNYCFSQKIIKSERIGNVTDNVVNSIKKFNVNNESIKKIEKVIYEAEKNIKLYATSGEIEVEVKDNFFKAKLQDKGPGIENIGRACEDGYTTANDSIKKQGYGLGKGLSLIQENVDDIEIMSIPGIGTTLEFSIKMM